MEGKQKPLVVNVSFSLRIVFDVATFALMLIHAILTLWGPAAFTTGNALSSFLDGLIAGAGWIGLVLGSIGGLALLTKRSATGSGEIILPYQITSISVSF